MNEITQNLKNHSRVHAPYHYVLAPIVLFHFIWSTIQAIRTPTWERHEILLLSIGLLVMTALVRTNSLKVQDRLIRLEERLRWKQVLSPDLAAQAEGLAPGQTVALRFASDGELPTLVPQILSGELGKPGDIKKAIVNWRGDHFRV